jgi:acetyl-CoA C-acetyltransferase
MAQNSDPVVILSFARTPIGGLQGALADVPATQLGATAVKAAVERAGVNPAEIERLYMGCVLPAGLGQAPARQAAILGGLPKSVQATTVNKVCGSGMQTVIMGAEALGSGAIDLVVAGGMESMTNAPYLLKKHRSGARFGHDTVYDHMALDGLEDAYENAAMGAFAQVTANAYELTREGMDDYTIDRSAAPRPPSPMAPSPRKSRPSPSRPAQAKSWWTPTSSPARAAPTRSPRCARPSPRTARSRRLPPRRSRTAPPPWS